MKQQNNLSQKVKKARIFSHLMDRFNLHSTSVLDVGCSEGHYLRHFGPGSMGVTIIESHVAEAKKHGLDVVLKNVEDPNFSVDKQFKVVWANNFFEHMNAPHPFLIKMRDAVTPDGTLILGVPVIPFFSFLTRFKKFRGAYAVSHVNFFTRKTLIETVRAAGWEIREARLFYMKNPLLDSLFNLIAPHIYVIATPKPNFTYAEKRLRSLEGYYNY